MTQEQFEQNKPIISAIYLLGKFMWDIAWLLVKSEQRDSLYLDFEHFKEDVESLIK